LAGVIAIAWPNAFSSPTSAPIGIAYVILAAVGVSMGNVAIKRVTGRADAVMTMGLQLLIGAVPLAVLSLLTEDVSSMIWSPDLVVILVILSIAGTSIAFWLWFEVLENVELNRANAFTFLVPILGLAIGAVFFEERFGWNQAAGIALILAGIACVQRDGRRPLPG
jgi:drug/metabolite transporter (DMT)-like permease